jgi:hypothetical protein
VRFRVPLALLYGTSVGSAAMGKSTAPIGLVARPRTCAPGRSRESYRLSGPIGLNGSRYIRLRARHLAFVQDQYRMAMALFMNSQTGLPPNARWAKRKAGEKKK